MATALLLLRLLLFLATSVPTSTQSASNPIVLGSTLSTNTNSNSWSSPSRIFSFGFYPEKTGFKVGIWLTGKPNITVVWTAWRDDYPLSDGATLILTNDGRLLVQTVEGQEIPISDILVLASSAAMLDSGNFVLYGSTSQIIWAALDSPTHTILAGQDLGSSKTSSSIANEIKTIFSPANEYDSSTGRFRLSMQQDGNLVLYPAFSPNTAENSYWNTWSSTEGWGVSLNLNQDGRLYLLDRLGKTIVNLTQSPFANNGTFTYRATLDADGIFRLYAHSNSKITVIWSSISDVCLPKGFCGYNAYCKPNATKATCLCPLGFVFVNPEDTFSDCERSFMANEENVSYYISSMDNTMWEYEPYVVLSNVNGDGCQHACLQDTKCAAAMFEGGRCSKHKFPLRYGRGDLNRAVTTFIKVANVSKQIPPAHKFPNKSSVILSVLLAVLIGIILILGVLFGFKIRVYRTRIQQYRDYVAYKDENKDTPKSFTYKELEKATRRFSQILGHGSSGFVYKGNLFGNVKIAVKKLDKVVERGERQFRSELNIITKTHHTNLIRLIGYCDEGAHRLLVYEFMRNGSLADLLFQERRPRWEQRARIAIDVARGLAYLHDEHEIIHCDIKPSNILLDDSCVAKISDFGISKILGIDRTRTLDGPRGTYGYIAPEWTQNNIRVTTKADVYSFGVMLLEIICCRKYWFVEDGKENCLSNWVNECSERGELDMLLAPGEMESEVEKERLKRMVKVGLQCISEQPSERPSMRSVVLTFGAQN